MGMQELYQKLYEDESLNYGRADKNRCPGVRSFPFYEKYLESPVIDLGCGRGDTVRRIKEAGYEAQGVDQIDLSNGMLVGDATTFDCSNQGTALCIDVLEHLDDDELHEILTNMSKAKRQIVQVHTGSSKEPGHPEELHINQKSESAWDEIIRKHFQFQHKFKPSQARILYFCGSEPIGTEQFSIPEHFKTRLMWAPDGSFWIPRRNPKLERYLNAHCIKIQDRNYFPKLVGKSHVEVLRDRHKGKVAYIVGKGPSLDLLTPGYFTHDGPVICINDSIQHLPDLGGRDKYVIQCDRNMEENCWPKDPATTLILHYRNKGLYEGYPNKMFFHQKEFDPGMSGPGGAIGVEVAKLMGCTHIVMLCFDACVNKKVAYAKCVGYESNRWGMKPDRFLAHRQRIDRQFKGTSHEWVIPGAQSSHESSASDTPLQLSDNLEAHHEPHHTEHSACSPATTEQPLKRGQVHQRMIVDHLNIAQQS